MKRVLKRIVTFIITIAMTITALPLGNGALMVKAATNFAFETMTYNHQTYDLGKYYVPKNASGKLPVVIFLHGLGSVKSDDYMKLVQGWIQKGYIKPMVLIAPTVDTKVTDFEGYAKKYIQPLMKRIKDGTLDKKFGVTLDKSNLSICGYSAGGMASVVAGSLYRDTFINVGGLSCALQLHYPGHGYRCTLDALEGTKDFGFTNNANKHLFMAASKTEGSGDGAFYKQMEKCYEDFGQARGFTTIAFDSGAHDINLFSQELFCFLYYIQNDVVPNDTVMKNVFGKATPRTVRGPGAKASSDKTTPTSSTALKGTVEITGTSVRYGFAMNAKVTNCNSSNLSYQWKRGNTVIKGATGKSYILQQADIGYMITCVITDKNKKLTGSISGTTSTTVLKGYGPAAPKKLTAVNTSKAGAKDGKIKNVTTAMEYATNANFTNAKSCTGTTITGLAKGTYYVRIKATDTTYAGGMTVITIK